MKKQYDIAAYIWPAYTGDEPRTQMFWPEGMGEWETVKKAVKRYPEHNWPRKPLWGYVNEADPYVMEMQIEAATDHGVNVFIYDWYWYDRRPFLENCLNNGFLNAKNNHKMKFYLMWANHDAQNLWDIRLSHDSNNVIWQGSITRQEFEIIAERLIEKYFKLDNYYTIDNKPVFMIYDIANFINGMGSINEAKAALDWFRSLAIQKGLPGLHLQLTYWSEHVGNLSCVDGNKTMCAYDIYEALGFDSASHYQFVHFTNIDRNYSEILADVKKEWSRIDNLSDFVYYPHISVSWDNTPRFKEFRPGIVVNNQPEEFEKGLIMAKEYADKYPDRPALITINSWNEWTESSYLQPDDLYGYGYLDAIRRVFK